MKLKDLDVCELMIIFLGLGVMISLIIFVSNFSYDVSERECVEFYKENHYITESCKKYSNKLEALDSNEK